MSLHKKLVNFALAALMLLIASNTMVTDGSGEVKSLNEGIRDSPVMVNYGIHDMIADKALDLLEARSPEKAGFISYWYLHGGSDDDSNSYNPSHMFPLPDDNYLAWTDDGPEGVTVEYFINNPEPGQDPQTDAVQYAQMLANRTMVNLTAWMLAGHGSKDATEISLMHAAAYNAGKMAKYVGMMSLFGHTDYSKWDQLSQSPVYHPSEIKYPYREYYESRVWSDINMETLYQEFWSNRTFNVPSGGGYDSIHTRTSNLAKWVNSRGEDPVQLTDFDDDVITVGYNYQRMLSYFMHNWENGTDHLGIRGFNQTLWDLTLDNLVAASENLTSMFEAIYDDAMESFLEIAPDLKITNWSTYPDPIIAGDTVMINATVGNDGGTRAENFRLLIEGPGGFINWRGMTLEPGEEKNTTFLGFEVGEDPEDFTITIDYLEVITESDETNNIINGTVIPLPEIHSSELSPVVPLNVIRRDSNKTMVLRLQNTGNRMDTYELTATSDRDGIVLTIPEKVKIKRASGWSFDVGLRCLIGADLGMHTITITATGSNSTAELEVNLSIIERSSDPVPVITGPSWGRIGEDITLSALESHDPDGDALYFTWIIPLQSNSTANEITVNYTKPDTYNIELVVFDGNVSSSLVWPLRIYPLVPDNISVRMEDTGISAVTIGWEPWRAGGLVAYWLEAAAVPGQGVASGRGPYIERYGFGNSSGRVGKFLPGTEIEVKISVEAEKFGNVTMKMITTKTNTIDDFEDNFKMAVEDTFLKIDFKPWVEPEGERDPVMVVERWYMGEFIPMDTPKEIIHKTRFQDSIRYPLGSNWGRYRAHLTYYWVNETISPFDIFKETEKTNTAPELNLTGWNQEFMLNINGTCRVWLVMGIRDMQDSVNATVNWGDGYVEMFDMYIEESGQRYISLFHNYSQIGKYEISIEARDWEGLESSDNATIEIVAYKETQKGKDEERSIWTLVGLIILGVFIVLVLIIMGFTAYKISKKDTEVDFKMKDFKSELEKEGSGTGTDFDQRRNLQIPTDSIMGTFKNKKDRKPSMINGKVTFDEE